MMTILSLFTFALIVFGAFGLAAAETNIASNAEASAKSYEKKMNEAMRSYSAALRQSWMTNYYGKTLSSLGEIVEIRIDRTIRLSTGFYH